MKLDGRAAAVEHGAAQVVVDQVAGGAAERFEGGDVPPQEALERLVEGEERSDGARVAEDHDESGDGAGALSDADLAERAPVDLRGLGRQGDHPAVDGAAGLGPQALHEFADGEDRAGIAALAEHLVDPRGAQPWVLRQRVADERQVRVEDAGPTHAGGDAWRFALDRGANGLTVEAELGRDGPDLPVLAVVQAPDLGALRGRDHRRSSSDSREARASGSATGSTARRPRNGWPRAPEPRRGPGRGVWSMAGGQRNPDPSRGGERGRRAGGRGGRGALRGCADAGLGRPAPNGGGRAPGTTARSRHGRGHTSRRWQTGGCSVGRSSGGAAGPRRRSARGDLRLDNAFEPWHNCTDRLGLVGARGGHEGPASTRALTPRLRPQPTLRERAAARHASPEAVDADTPVDANNRAHSRLQNRADAVSHSDHSHHPLLHSDLDEHARRETISSSRSLTSCGSPRAWRSRQRVADLRRDGAARNVRRRLPESGNGLSTPCHRSRLVAAAGPSMNSPPTAFRAASLLAVRCHRDPDRLAGRRRP